MAKPLIPIRKNEGNGFVVASLHYSADPDKDDEWKEQASQNMSEERWAREMEIDWNAAGGTFSTNTTMIAPRSLRDGVPPKQGRAEPRSRPALQITTTVAVIPNIPAAVCRCYPTGEFSFREQQRLGLATAGELVSETCSAGVTDLRGGR